MNEYGKQVKKQMDTYIDNPDSIDKEISDIQNATHGVEVRGALAAGVKKSFDKSVEARDITENLLDGSYDQGLLNTEIENRMDNLYNTKGQAMDELHDAKETELDNLKQEYADKATTLETTYAPRLTSIETEIEDARGGETNLGDRLNEFSSQLAQTTDDLNVLSNLKVDKVVLNGSTLEFYANNALVHSVSVAGAGNSQAVRDYIDTLVSDGLIEGVTLADGSVDADKLSYSLRNSLTLIAENKIDNGNFEGTHEPWLVSNGELSVENNELIFSVTGLSSSARIRQIDKVVAGHKYFTYGEIFPKYSNNTRFLVGSSTYGTNFSPTPNQWNEIYSIIEAPVDGIVAFYHSTSANYVVGDTFKIRKVLMIDLTETFGVGNEPTNVDFIYKIIKSFPSSWFDGKANLLNVRDIKKQIDDVSLTEPFAFFFTNNPVDFDFENQEIKFFRTNKTYLFYNKKSHDFLGTTIDFSSFSNSTFVKILFDTETKELKLLDFLDQHPSNQIIVGMFSPSTQKVLFNGDYVINGGSSVEGLNKIFYDWEDMAWSWWIYPLAVRHNGIRDKTYIGYTDSEGFSGLGSLDNDTGLRIKNRLKKTRADDHNAVAVDIMEDGRIISAYSTGHNTDGKMRIRISKKVENIEEFESETTVETGGKVTYAQLFKGAGKWWLFFRGPEGDECSYTSSVDGKNWSSPVALVDYTTTCYPKIQYTTDSNILRFVITTNPNQGDVNFRLGFFNMSTGNMELENGTVLGSERITREVLPVIVPKDGAKSQRLLDVAVTDVNETIIGYSTFTLEEDADDCDYRVAHWSDDNLNVDILTTAGAPFYAGSNYVGGIAFGYDKNELYLSREDDNIWHIEKWITSDQVTWTKEETIHTSRQGHVAIRPILEKDGDKILWHEGVYDSSNYEKFNTDVKYVKIREL